MDNNDFILKILAELEDKGIKTGYDKLKKQLEKDPAKIDVILDTSGTLGRTKGSVKKLAAELHNELSVEINKLKKQGHDINLDLSVGDVEKVINNVITQTDKLEKEFDSATSKAQKFLAQFNNKSGGVLVNSAEFKAVQTAISGLGDTHSIDDLNKAMNNLETTYNNMVSNLRNGGKSLNPFINAINDMKNMDSTLKGIELDFQSLASKPKAVADAIKDLHAQQTKVNQYSQGTVEWAQEYGILQSKIVAVKNEIQNVAKAEKASNTDESNKVKYYQRIIDNNKTIYSLKNKLLTADVRQTEEIDKQITKLEKRNQYNYGQLNKKGLTDNSWEQIVNGSKDALESQLRINSAKQEDIANTKAVAQAEKERIATLREQEALQKNLDKIQHSLNVGDYDAQIETIKKGFISLSGDANEAETHVKGLRDALQSMHDATDDNGRLNAEKSYRLELEKTDNQLTIAKAKAKEYVDVLKVQKLKNDIQDWLRKNTAATNEAKTAMTAYLNTLDDVGHVSQSSFNEAKQALDNWDTKMRVAGKLGKSFSETFKEGVKSFTSWAISSGSVMEVWNGLKNGLRTIKDLDTALVDLRKTTDATAQELEDFYYSSNETAKQLGVTTSEVINATSAWSRLGYAIEDATTLAKNSAILASISPEMDIDTATDGLVSTLKAFKIEAEDSLDGVISKINIIGNTQAVDNNDVVDILTRSSSAMAEANNTLEETIALGVAATEITRDADAVGTMLKTVSMRIRGYDEQLESYTDDLANLSGTIADLTKTASSPGGISLFTDETKTTYKSTYQILKDISEIYDELDDKTQAQLLEALAGKRQGQAVAAIINNFENAEKSMNSMANSAGNAMQEMEVIYDSMDYKLNQTQETATGIAQNIFGREDMKLVIDVFNDFLGLLDKATDKLGLFGTLGLGAGVFAGFKNAGICV